MPAIIRNIDRDMATIIMVDSNLQREDISPMERAQAYKMKLEAIKRRAGRPSKEEIAASENGGQDGHNLRGVKSRDLVAEGTDDSSRTVQRYIRLTELSPELQQMVDDKKIAVTPAVELSYLKPEEQALVVETIECEQATPLLSQAQRLKKKSQAGELNEDTVLSIMSEEKKPEKYDLTMGTFNGYSDNRMGPDPPPYILVTSTFSDSAMRAKILNRGADDCSHDPCAVGDLVVPVFLESSDHQLPCFSQLL